MKQVGNVIISDEVWDCNFACDLSQCKGKCCQYGDIGSPITEDEEKIIKSNLDNVAPMLSKENMALLRKGITIKDERGDLHIVEGAHNTPCPLSFINEDGIVLCSLHNHCLRSGQNVLNLKPLWCSLFPIIIKDTPIGFIINCFLPEFCRSTKDAPPLLISFSDYLSDIFGQKWMDAVKEEYKREGRI